MAVIGLTIPISADASKFNKEMKKMDRSVKATSKDVKELSRSLKFEWNNGKFLQAQKQAKDALQQTDVKADALRKRLKYLDTVGTNKNSAEYRKLQSELIKTDARAVILRKELKALNNLRFTMLASKLKAVGQSLSTMGMQLTRMVTLPILAVGVASVKMGLDLDTALRKVSTLFGDVAVDSDLLKSKIQDLSIESGITATELSEGLYQALSAGVPITEDATEAIDFLTVASSLAKAGFTTTAKAVDAMTTVMNAYGLSASDAAHVSNVLLATQNKGKTTVDELAGSLAQVIPTAANLGVEFEDVAAAMAGLTAQGIPTAGAATSLNQVLGQLGKTGTAASDILREKTGKSFKELSEEGVSLSDVFGILLEGAEDNDVALIDLFGNIRAAKGFMSLTANEGKGFADALDYVSNSAGLTAVSLAQVNGPAQQLKSSLERVKVSLQQLGDIMIPVVVQIADKIGALVQKFTDLDTATKTSIIKAALFAAALGPVLLILGKMTMGVGAIIGIIPKLYMALSFLAAHPIVAVLLIIVGLLALMYNRSEEFRNAVNSLVKTFSQLLKPVLDWYMGILVKIMNLLVKFVDFLAKFLAPAVAWVSKAIQDAFSAIPGMIEGVVKGVEWMVNSIIKLINKLIDGVNKVGEIVGITIGRIQEADFSVNIPDITFDVTPELQPLDTSGMETVDVQQGDVFENIDLTPEQIINGTNVDGDPTTLINNDYSDKDIVINVTVENFAENVDVDDLVKQINLKLAEAM